MAKTYSQNSLREAIERIVGNPSVTRISPIMAITHQVAYKHFDIIQRHGVDSPEYQKHAEDFALCHQALLDLGEHGHFLYVDESAD